LQNIGRHQLISNQIHVEPLTAALSRSPNAYG
jgi:hypothetical protein